MARFFFHMAMSQKQVFDVRGKELQDLAAAHEHALHLVCRATSCLCERETRGLMIKIGAFDGTVPLTVLFPGPHFGERNLSKNVDARSAPSNPWSELMGRSRKLRGTTELDPKHPVKTAPRMPSAPTILTELLRTFVALVDSGSFIKAAQLLDLTHPEISLQMKHLESLIGADLLAKNTTGVQLTERGLEVLRVGRRIDQ